jgi:hypothetical protein
VKETIADPVPVKQAVPERKPVLSDDSLLSIIRSHGESIIDLVDAGDSKIAICLEKVSMENREFTSVLFNDLGQPADTTVWTGTPEYTLKKRLYIDKTLGLIYKKEIVDTVLRKFEPVFDGGDSSVVVDNGIPGGAEIERFDFNEEEIGCEAEPFGKILKKQLKPGQVLVSDYSLECRDNKGMGLVCYRHIRDKKYKNGYWVAEKSGWLSGEMSDGAYWSKYVAILFLREKTDPTAAGTR